ncbi:Glutathione S-transferase 2 [Eumeta japonica]|uniref:glutathione transferase n=1 Tax=Eumeta variegata TaxID=151549 RepID=A0A4C1WZN5_EUMVA|nr:Glutathione S-transferase 2 [Eumeta japonica]
MEIRNDLVWVTKVKGPGSVRAIRDKNCPEVEERVETVQTEFTGVSDQGRTRYHGSGRVSYSKAQARRSYQRVASLEEWQERYTEGNLDEITKCFLLRMEQAYRVLLQIKMTSQTAQTLTGHEQDVLHVLEECHIFLRERAALEAEIDITVGRQKFPEIMENLVERKKILSYCGTVIDEWRKPSIVNMPKYVYRYFPVKALGEGPRLLFSYGKEEFEDIRITFEEWDNHKSIVEFHTYNSDPPATNGGLRPLLGETLFGELPTLEIDGKQYAQSVAISRYLGRKYGISGATPEEDLLIDQMVDFVNDIRLKFYGELFCGKNRGLACLGSKGVVVIEYLDRGATVSGSFYAEQIKKLRSEIRKKGQEAAVAHYEEDEVLKEKKFKDSSAVYPPLLKKLDSIIADNNGHLALGKLTWGDFVLAGMIDYMKVMLRMPDLEEKYVNIKKVADKVVAIPQVKAYMDKAPKTDF